MTTVRNRFEDLGISDPILKAIEDIGFEEPTEVQVKAIPHALNNKDLVVKSKTGSGKTAVYGISILQLTDPDEKNPQALILTPTRELAVQVDRDLRRFSRYLKHRTTAVYGQHSMNVEINELNKGVSIVTGTPGRVYDHITSGNLPTGQIRFLVLDEADRMLDMGFIDQVERIIKSLPKDRTTLLFSATIPPEIHRICKRYMKAPMSIEIESKTKTVDTIQQFYYRVDHNNKRTWLNRILLAQRPESCMIFCNTRRAVDQVKSFLVKKGYACQGLHGEISQGRRLKTMQQFKRGEFGLLVATDVAARGIHVDNLSLVINYDVPNEKDSYVHRIGRTGRAGNGGRAISLVTVDDIMTLYEIEEHIGSLIPEKELPSEESYSQDNPEVIRWIKSNSVKKKPHSTPSKQEQKKSQKGRSGSKPYQRRNKSQDRRTGTGGAAYSSSGKYIDKERKKVGKAHAASYSRHTKYSDTTARKPQLRGVSSSGNALRHTNIPKGQAPGKIKGRVESQVRKQTESQMTNQIQPEKKSFLQRIFQRLFKR